MFCGCCVGFVFFFYNSLPTPHLHSGVRARVCMYARVCACVCTLMHACMFFCSFWILGTSSQVRTRGGELLVCVLVCLCVHVCLRVCVCVCARVLGGTCSLVSGAAHSFIWVFLGDFLSFPAGFLFLVWFFEVCLLVLWFFVLFVYFYFLFFEVCFRRWECVAGMAASELSKCELACPGTLKQPVSARFLVGPRLLRRGENSLAPAQPPR